VLPTEIVVLDQVPNDISMVSGIVTEAFQTPLAHINLLSKNRGTPNMAVRDAFSDPGLRALEGALVRLEVGPQTFVIESADPADAQSYWDSLRPAEALVPSHDLAVSGLQPLAARGIDDSLSIGAKAANMAEMMAIDGGSLPLPDQPFAVPFHYYDAHLTAHGLWDEIDAVIADAPGLAPIELKERLFAIRWALFQAPLDAELSALLASEVTGRWGDERRIRFRSSTNVEDLPDFSGAGLYTSASGSALEGSIDTALKVVWASVWNYQAFVERDFYRIQQQEVRMGVLVHPSFTDETANGVALTINEFSDRRPAFYINSQVGDISVTNPTGLATPEQVLFYRYFETPEIEVISRSSLSDAPVLTSDELEILAGHLEVIHSHFLAELSGSSSFAMDVEFKLGPERQIVIKQARPLKSR